MERKVVIIGCGNVGSTFAYSLYKEDLCDILLLNHNKCRANSNVLDILDCTVNGSHHKLMAGDYSDIRSDDIVVICAGNSSLLRSGNRLSELENSRRIANDIIANLKKVHFRGVLINVMNPCDDVTNMFRGLDMPKESIIGTGTLLETLRLRRIIFERFKYNTSAFIVGKHGDENSIVGPDLVEYLPDILADVHNRVWRIYEGKGFTNFGISNALLQIVYAIWYDTNIELCVSTLCCDVYGFDNVALSIPCIIGKHGVKSVNEYGSVGIALNKLFKEESICITLVND